MDLKKKTFIERYAETYGNVSASCELTGISRGTYYKWLNEDEEFRIILNEIEPESKMIDFAENALIKRIAEGDTTAIIFTLKTKGRERGYIEKQIHAITQDDDTKKNLESFHEKLKKAETPKSNDV